MNKKIRASWQRAEPDEEAIDRMPGNILAEAHTSAKKERKSFPMLKLKIAIPIAACLVIALLVAVPMLNNSTEPGPIPTDNTEIEPGMAVLSDDRNIYYVDEDGAIACESVYLQKWMELNNVEGVTLVECKYENNGTETHSGDSVAYTPGEAL